MHGPRRFAGAFFLCWPRLRPNPTNSPQCPHTIAAFVHGTRSTVPTARATDSDPLEERQGAIPETPGVVPRPA